MTENIRALNGTIQVREAGKGGVKIAGYANKFGKIDSYGTRFDPASAILERFNDNPVLLFNHDVMQPIGKVVKVEKRDDGLFVEAELSNSNAPQVAYVRDLVQEGCLKAFSIRFGDMSAQMEKDPENPGCMLIKNWELQELSIVSLPAQSESLFSLRMAQNAFRNVTNKQEALKVLENIRGAKAAAYVNECIVKAAGDISRDEIMERLGEQSGLEAADLAATLEGDKEMTDAFITAAVDVVNCDKDKLTELNAVDLEESKEKTEVPADVEPAPIERAEDKLDPVQECVSSKIPLLIKEGKDQEQAVAMAIQMCGEERSCSDWRPNAEQLESFVRLAAESAEPISTPVENTMPNDNAMLQKLDSMVSLLGSIVTEIKSLKDEMTKVTKVEPETKSVEIEIESEEKPEDEPEEMTPDMQRSLNALWERVEQKAQSMGL